MVNTTLNFRLIPLFLMLPFAVTATHHEGLLDEGAIDEAQYIEELLSEESSEVEADIQEIDIESIEESAVEQSGIQGSDSGKPDILVDETPLISPADDNIANSGVIDRYPASAQAAQSSNVTRSAFTLNVVDREPVDDVNVVSEDSVYYFTELSGLEGAVVRHRWLYQGEVMADVEFMVGGPRWRVWSKKSLIPRWAGRWTVTVVDGSGTALQSETIDYQP